jgi:antitoxin ParD1/3/4
MRSTQQMSITLPIEMATLVKSRVSSGDYASESEVIREGLRALQERENAVEQIARISFCNQCFTTYSTPALYCAPTPA